MVDKQIQRNGVIMNLININYNITESIEQELDARQLVAVINDESLKLARDQRAGLNKFITGLDKQRTALKKEIDNRFKEEMSPLHARLKEFDKNIDEYEETRRNARKEEIKAFFDTLDSGLDFDKLPIDEFLSAYPSYKTKVELAIHKVKSEIGGLQTAPKALLENYLTDYDLSRATQEFYYQTPLEHTDMPILKVYLDKDNKDKVINFLNALGVVYEQIR